MSIDEYVYILDCWHQSLISQTGRPKTDFSLSATIENCNKNEIPVMAKMKQNWKLIGILAKSEIRTQLMDACSHQHQHKTQGTLQSNLREISRPRMTHQKHLFNENKTSFLAKNTTGQKITKWAIFDDENKQEFQLPLTSVCTKDEDKETDRSIWSSHGEDRMKMADITETNAGTTLVIETLTDKPRVTWTTRGKDEEA